MLGRIGNRTMKYFLLTAVFSLASPASAFSISSRQQFRLFSSVPSDVVGLDLSLDDIKADLVRACTRSSKPSLSEVRSMVGELEDKAEQLGVGQASSSSGLLNGEWELLYSPEDVTRSSPFFWAFRKAFPDQSDQIFGITDAIPAPIKEVGPAYQTIKLEESGTGQFVSSVKVATLNGMATSQMTTRGTIVSMDGVDGIKIRVDTTKPEESTVLKTLLGPLGAVVNESFPAFPSGNVLERIQSGSSQVVMRTTFCDEGLRISRNDETFDDVYVWRRRAFESLNNL